MRKVKVTKLQESENPDFKADNPETHRAGKDNGAVSLPVEYTIEGTLIAEPEVGGFIAVDRTKRNGVECFGYFRSSRIVNVSEDKIETANSIYLIENL